MTFQATKCDECKRIQGESNHWMRIQVWFEEGKFVGVVMLPMGAPSLLPAYLAENSEYRDLCGQACTVKHVAKLLGWNAQEAASATS